MSGSQNYLRTKKSLRNSVVALSLQIVTLLVGFFSRKIFLDYLGTEILGLNTTATSLLNFLNLAELGIGSAIAVTLYKPLFDQDRNAIREIVALQGWLYKRIAFFVLGGSLVLMFFFPEQIFRLFTTDPEVISIGLKYVPIAIVMFYGSAARSATNALINGSGNYKVNFATAIMDGIVMRIGLALLFGLALGMKA